MLKILYTLLFFTINISLYAQSAEVIAPFYNNGKWGFMDKDKNIIVCPKYEEAYPSTYDRYRVKLKGKYGFIDNLGKLVIKAKYDEAEDFQYGIAKVKRRNKTEYIKKDGKRNKVSLSRCGNHSCMQPRLYSKIEVIEGNEKFGIVHDMYLLKENGLASYQSDTIPPIFDSIVPITHQLMYLAKDSLNAFLRVGNYWSGADNVCQNLKFDYEDIKLFDCNFCKDGFVDLIGIKKNGLWGYMKVYFAAEDYIEPKYLSINSLAKGFALVEYERGKLGYIDSSGNEYFIR